MFGVWTLAEKDLRLLTRNYGSLFWIFAFPLLLALLFGVAFGGAGSKMRPIHVAFVDLDRSKGSQELQKRLEESKALELTPMEEEEAREAVRKGKLAAFVLVPKGYGEPGAMFSPKAPKLQVGVDPSQKATEGYLQGILTEAIFKGLQEQFANPAQMEDQLPKILQDIDKDKALPEDERQALKQFLSDMNKALKKLPAQDGGGKLQGGPFQGNKLELVPITQEASGPRSAFEITFPSSILWGILGCVQSFVISIVLERTGGTFLRLRVSPLSWSQVLAGKALACFLAATIVCVVLLVLGGLLFGVRLNHPLQLLMAIGATACCFVGIMMLLSTLGKTVGGVAGAAWGILMPLTMIGGGMIPLIAMPDWMLALSNFSPIKWGIVALEGAIWRDYSFAEMLLPCTILLVVGAVCFGVGVKKLSWGEG